MFSKRQRSKTGKPTEHSVALIFEKTHSRNRDRWSVPGKPAHREGAISERLGGDRDCPVVTLVRIFGHIHGAVLSRCPFPTYPSERRRPKWAGQLAGVVMSHQCPPDVKIMSGPRFLAPSVMLCISQASDSISWRAFVSMAIPRRAAPTAGWRTEPVWLQKAYLKG